ncbi:MAG TPA: tetratricopeptide repeat protein [Pirellulales bacterium]|nr:tetratricopeptide repeat protein [Pirellulales bacterium]
MPKYVAPLALALSLAAAADVVWAGPAEDQFAVAAGHYKAKRWKLAAEEFQAFLADYAEHANSTRARFYLAESLVQLRRFDEAAEQFADFLKRAPEDRLARKALFRCGEANYLAGHFDNAQAELDRFLKKYPDDPLNAFTLPYLGDLAARRHDPQTAQALFARGLKQFAQGPMQDDCRFGLARAWEEQGKEEDARRLYLALASKPTSNRADEAQYRLAVSFYRGGDYEQALECFSEFATTFAKSPLRPRAELAAGQTLYHAGEIEQAHARFEQLAGRGEIGLEARYWLGLAEKAQHDWPAAAATLTAVAQTADADEHLAPAARFHAGEALLHAGKNAEAEAQFSQVLQRWPQSDFADKSFAGRIQVALAADDHAAVDRLADEFDTRFAHSALKPRVDRARGRSLLARKDYPAAIALFEQLVNTPAKPADGERPAPDALERQQPARDRYLLATALLGAERYQEALAALAKIDTRSLDAEDEQVDAGLRELQVDVLRARAMALMGLERFADARSVIEALLAAQPDGETVVWAKAELAVCLARLGQLDHAKAVYAELSEQSQDAVILPATRLALAEAAMAKNDFAWSSELFAKLASQPSAYSARGLSGLAWSQYQLKQLPAAAATFERLLNDYPNDALAIEAALTRGQILEQLEQPEPALAMYQRVIAGDSSSAQLPQALLLAARLQERLGRLQDAAELYERLIHECPELPQREAVLYESAWVLRGLGRHDEADQRFEQLRQATPRGRLWADAVYRLAERAAQQKEFDRADELLKELFGGQPAPQIVPHALFLQGQIAVGREAWPQVAEPLKRLIAEFPDSELAPLAQFWLAEAAYRQANFESAGEQLRQLAEEMRGKQAKWLPMIALRQAQILAQKKEWHDALEIASQIETDYPDFDQQYEVDYLMGRCQAAQGNFDDARSDYRRATRSETGAKTETAAKAQWMIGETYFHQEDYESALREYLRVEILYAFPTWQAAALLQAGKCHEHLGEWQPAVELYARLLKNYPETDFAQDASERLKTAQARAQAKK